MLELYETPVAENYGDDQLVLETQQFILGEQVATSKAKLPGQSSRTSRDHEGAAGSGFLPSSGRRDATDWDGSTQLTACAAPSLRGVPMPSFRLDGILPNQVRTSRT